MLKLPSVMHILWRSSARSWSQQASREGSMLSRRHKE
jgi:hypothetical protein